jgi:hypothetical protein
LSAVDGQPALLRAAGDARLAAYSTHADDDVGRASDLYLWASHVGGALHAHVAFVEIAVRNAIDRELRSWNESKNLTKNWTAPTAAPAPVYDLLKRQLSEARARAAQAAADRHPSHPRYRAEVTHDDVVSHLMFGSWVRLIRPASAAEDPTRQRMLWAACLMHAFPHADPSDDGRDEIGRQLDQIRRLRNRVAHHDNILGVDLRHRLNGMLALLARIDPRFTELAMSRSNLRSLVQADPRRQW